ncbi:phytanoyl-CoA dioxygenase family protein [Oceanibium sediminis]|uniref:phytanoyl-CoA dioxygenase family protein n=1 Tax=Oceanibium sediminis TaxID=2026339 RepID=UPI000DD3EA19|nr:phytanoyl-CoA dioxygenase family protein [Oceanibium sediminis]
MTEHDIIASRTAEVWYEQDAGDLAAFKALTARTTDPADWPFAERVESNIPVYDGPAVHAAAQGTARNALMAEWAEVFRAGPGIIVIKGAIDPAIVAKATDLFDQLIAHEKAENLGGGDHFAKPGANDRVWNAAQKHCLADPAGFAAYYGGPVIDLAARAWLGDGYQVTAQVNRVNPGGAAQTAHRDYHLGFMSQERATAFPAHVHALSPALTLQGAVAHCDMPVESGPTMLLPWSQLQPEGYIAFNRPDFQKVFAERHVQMPLETGDALFFNPAVMHGAGTNRTSDVRRMANLLQIGSAFGRSIEAVDRSAMVRALYPVLRAGGFDATTRACTIAAAAEGYAYPTNLDIDPPVGGLAPRTQAELLAASLDANDSPERFGEIIDAYDSRRIP